MVKPVFKTLFDMKSAPTADAAQEIATNFLKSEAAGKVDRAQAGTFLKEVEGVFKALEAPQQYKAVLRAMTDLNNKASYHVQEFAGNALETIEMNSRHVKELLADADKNAAIINKVRAVEKEKGPTLQAFENASDTDRDPVTSDLYSAGDFHHLTLAVNNVMMERDVGDDRAADFLKVIAICCRRMKTPSEDQEKLLQFISDSTSTHEKLHHLANDKIVALSNKREADEAARLQSHHSLGLA